MQGLRAGLIRGVTVLALAILGATLLAGAQGIPAEIRTGPGAPLPKPSAAVPALPPTAPTAPAPATLTAAPQATSVVSAVRRARVDYRDGLVTVVADNSSLNQILREVARKTGMKITGGVTDERVFGTYGPADLASVLATLLDGTGSNLLLIQDAVQAPVELVLTPRQGGPSPPSPMSSQDAPDAQDDLPPQLTPRTSNAPSATPQQPVNPPQPQPFTPPTVAPAETAAPAAANTTTTTDQSPNGVKTPQQIYDQLMQMQQQQKKAPAPQ